MSELTGPGHTKYDATDEGVIRRRWHNDPSWTNIIADPDELRPWKIASMLQDAYAAGLADKALEIRRALGATD